MRPVLRRRARLAPAMARAYVRTVHVALLLVVTSAAPPLAAAVTTPVATPLALPLATSFVSPLASSAAPAAATRDGALMQQRGQHPLNSVFGLPVVAARPVAHAEWQVSIEHSNSFAGGVRGEELLVIDGESTELSIRHRRRLGRCWQGEAVLPFVAHSRGWADRAIDDWHKAFGLPDAERDRFTMFDLRYVWLDADGNRRELERATGGLGDAQLALQRTLGCAEAEEGGSGWTGAGHAIARIGLKLPTGDSDALLGSGATDAYADLQSPVWSLGARWRFGAAIGAIATGDSKLFERQRTLAAYGSLGSELRLHPRWSALVQIDWHSPFHDSALRGLGEIAASLGVGVRYLARGGRFELSIGEDAAIDTTPDIVARLAWTWRPRVPLPPPPSP